MIHGLRLLAVVWVVSMSTPARASSEWWHHLNDIESSLWFCIDTCSHVDRTGSYVVSAETDESDILLGTTTARVNLSL